MRRPARSRRRTAPAPGHPSGRRAGGGEAGRPTGERGAASVELVIIFPVVLLLVMTLIQAALWFYARSIALGAAEEGAHAGRLQPTSPTRAQSAAQDFLGETAQDLLSSRDVTVAGSPTTIQVTVTGTSISLFPGLAGWSVTQSAAGPVERSTP